MPRFPIEQIEVFPARVPMTRPFAFASGKLSGFAPHIFVKVTTAGGAVGWGEGRPITGWSYETPESVVTTLRRYLIPATLGHDCFDRGGLVARWNQVVGRGPSTGMPIAKAALDMAVHDVAARISGVSLRQFLGGGVEVSPVELSYTITAHDASEATEQVREAREQGFKHMNFKAAVTPATDAAVAESVRTAVADDAFVWADANQGFQLHEARRAAEVFAALGVNVLEQPLPADSPHLTALRQAVNLPLAFDETTVSPADFARVLAVGVADYLVVKVTRSGGVWASSQQIAAAQSFGLPLLLSGLTDGLLTKVAACQLCAAHGFTGPAALNGSQFIDESAIFPAKAQIEREGKVFLPDATGIGVQPDEAALRKVIAPEWDI